jgi:hypothetical protein
VALFLDFGHVYADTSIPHTLDQLFPAIFAAFDLNPKTSQRMLELFIL